MLRLSSAGTAGFLAAHGGTPAPVSVLGAGDGHDPVALPAGVWVRRMRWHPASETHLAVLLSDGRMHLYAVPAAPLAEMGAGGQAPATRRLVREQELVLVGAPTSHGAGSVASAAPWSCPPVDFAFFPHGSAGWDATAAMLLARDGSLGLLCPGPMPFGGHVSASTAALMRAHAQQLQGPARGDVDAWLAAALPSSDSQLGSSASRCVAIAPHALPGRAPALMGPLPQLGADGAHVAASSAEGAPAEAVSLSLVSLPGPHGAALLSCVIAVDGTASLSLVLDSCLEAREALCAPVFGAAVTSVDRDLSGVPRRARAVVNHAALPAVIDTDDAPALPVVLPVDIVSTGVCPGRLSAPAHGLACTVAWEPPPGRRLFVAAGSRVCCVTLTWLPVMPRLLAEAAGACAAESRSATTLPLPVVELLRDGPHALVGAALRRDVLCAATILTLEAPDGKLCVLEPTPVVQATHADSADQLSGKPSRSAAATVDADADAADDGAAALEALAGGPPRGAVAPPVLPADATTRAALGDSPAGASAVAAGASALRETYLQWAHRAHAELGRRAVRLGTEGARQAAAVQQLRMRRQQLAARSAELSARTQAAQVLHGNLSQRARLLAELVRELPRDSAAEQALGAQLRAWADMLPALAGRVDAVRQRAQSTPAHEDEIAQRMRVKAQAALPVVHMRRLQDALSVSAAQLAATVDKIRALQSSTETSAQMDNV